MTNKAEGGGLVQKLLFPGYTHSGANDAFHPTEASPPLHKNSNEEASTTMSQADTEVHDNLSRSATLLRQQQQQQQEQQEQQSSSAAQTTANKPPQILPRWKQQPSTVPPLFASTQPPRRGQVVLPPSSPPKLARKPFGPATERSLSNVALADGEQSLSGGNHDEDQSSSRQKILPFASNDKDDDNPFNPTQQSTTTTAAAPTTNDTQPQEADAGFYHDSEHKESEQHRGDPVWEEEATPAQTAMAKDIIFRHRIIRRSKSLGHEEEEEEEEEEEAKDDDDVSSTASEMGTVIGATQLQDLDRDFGTADPTAPTSPMHPAATEQLYSKTVWDQDGQAGSNENNKQEQGTADAVNNASSRKVSHDSSLSAEASQRLSRAIRRIGSGIKGSLPSRSAPSTPRPLTHNDSASSSPMSPRTPSRKSQQQSQHASSSNTTATTSSNHRGSAPTSFLLRSPGSSAFCAANSSKKQRDALLSPRFLQVPPAIDEDKQSPPGPALPELQPSSNPLSMARACFSFDNYYYQGDVDEAADLPATAAAPYLRPRSKQSSPRRSKHKTSSSGRTQWLHESQSWDVGAASSSRVVVGSNNSNHHGAAFAFSAADTPLYHAKTEQRPSMSAAESLSQEVEHEDALDLLACLVERGVSLETTGATTAAAAKEGEEDEEDNHAKVLEKVRAALADDKQQQEWLDRLLRSHEYALEMSRASQSASSWLKSIGRGKDADSEKDEAGASSKPATESSYQKKENDPLDLVTARALMHSAQKELGAKTSQMEELNQELAKCRAEIGRLKTQQQQQSQLAPFQSPNRSILDSQNEDDEEETDDDDEAIAEDRSDGYLDRSFPSQSRTNVVADTGELTKYKKALEEANQKIRELYQKTKEAESGEAAKPAPIVTVTPFASPPSPGGNTADTDTMDEENFETEWTDLVPSLPPPPDHGLKSPIVQTVLEAWTPDTDLHQSLITWMETIMGGASPHDIPPLAISNLDSQVRDGLIMHVLPLLLRRADIRVDVQTRTLRRTTYDLAVAVDTASTPLMDLSLRRRHWENLSARSEAGVSVTHSTVTALAENRAQPTPVFRDRHGNNIDDAVYGQSGNKANGERNRFPYPLIHQDAMASNTGFSYDEMTEDLTADGSSHPAGLMSALGGALGGFMLRRPLPRDASSPAAAVVGSHFPEADRYRSALKEEQNGNVEAQFVKDDDADKTPTAANTGAAGSTPSTSAFTPQQSHQGSTPMLSDAPDGLHEDDLAEEEEQPYHRVVSAPPGRIGVTFVEYRGHAMVSKVAADSPLAGWMFPSDILIAIDELPVSGMLVRDIIQILRERVDNQRALRIISCHAMDHAFNAAAMNSSQIGEPTG